MPDITGYPVTLTEVKSWLRIDADYLSEDELLQSLVISETQRYEKRLNLGIVAGTVREQQAPYDDYHEDWWYINRTNTITRLNYGPVDSTTIVVKDYQGNNLSLDDYTVYASSYPQITGLPYGAVVTYQSKGLNPVPEDLKRAILMRIAIAYDNRTGALDETVQKYLQGNNPDSIADQYNRSPI